MAVLGRYRSDKPSSDAIEAAVLILLFPVGSSIKTVLIRRSNTHLQDRHRGQVSFPGGKKDQHDTDHYSTALREASEEIGIVADDLDLLGKLSKLYIPVSNFIVSPYVSIVDYRPSFIRDTNEVDEIIEVDLHPRDFKRAQKHKDMTMHNGMVIKQIPHFDVQGHIVWGATAMILAEFFSLTGLSV